MHINKWIRDYKRDNKLGEIFMLTFTMWILEILLTEAKNNMQIDLRLSYFAPLI